MLNTDLGDDDRSKIVPPQEDMPLLLAWVRPIRVHLACSRRNCGATAQFEIDCYEDIRPVLPALAHGVPLKEVEDRLWKQTTAEQLAGRYIIHMHEYECHDCARRATAAFINTKETLEIEVMLDAVARGTHTLVQYHFLSNPTVGLVTPINNRLGVNTPQEWLAWMRVGLARGDGLMWKAGEGEVRE
jgi:hypothetical protein